MSRWSPLETEKLAQMRVIVGDAIAARDPLPEVTGDRRLLRFLRGQAYNIEKASHLYLKFLHWRDTNNVDRIRNEILSGGIKSPLDFPHGEKILRLIPQIVIAPDVRTKFGHVMCFEEFNFAVDSVLKEIKKEEYILFMIYALEYKTMILEQLSNEKEAILKDEYKDDPSKPYGVILGCCVIRDFTGFSLSHVSGDGKTLLSWIFEIATDNYPELLYRSHLVNVPWIFNTIWFFLRGLMDARTIAKITISGREYLKHLTEDFALDGIPTQLHGSYTYTYKPFHFDLSLNGPLYYPGGPQRFTSSGLSHLSPVVLSPAAPTEPETKESIDTLGSHQILSPSMMESNGTNEVVRENENHAQTSVQSGHQQQHQQQAKEGEKEKEKGKDKKWMKFPAFLKKKSKGKSTKDLQCDDPVLSTSRNSMERTSTTVAGVQPHSKASNVIDSNRSLPTSSSLSPTKEAAPPSIVNGGNFSLSNSNGLSRVNNSSAASMSPLSTSNPPNQLTVSSNAPNAISSSSNISGNSNSAMITSTTTNNNNNNNTNNSNIDSNNNNNNNNGESVDPSAPLPGESIRQYKKRISQLGLINMEKMCSVREWRCL